MRTFEEIMGEKSWSHPDLIETCNRLLACDDLVKVSELVRLTNIVMLQDEAIFNLNERVEMLERAVLEGPNEL